MSQEIEALSSELEDLAGMQSYPASGCHVNSIGTMMLMVKPNHDQAQIPGATVNEPVGTGKKVQLIDDKLTDKTGRHDFRDSHKVDNLCVKLTAGNKDDNHEHVRIRVDNDRHSNSSSGLSAR
ncbi:hypothetical protein B0A48_12919 [Cryoendolithus antarcticus]|uniref:Uncharacterized protein n=1 Tax=Cryoendolithus antarcticus TaxID=1507870 RepID=A0A1V8SQP9_9PEZI|nr:hypothetical protein B0A48_12919 [Cryoendolithus antarcticus]